MSPALAIPAGSATQGDALPFVPAEGVGLVPRRWHPSAMDDEAIRRLLAGLPRGQHAQAPAGHRRDPSRARSGERGRPCRSRALDTGPGRLPGDRADDPLAGAPAGRLFARKSGPTPYHVIPEQALEGPSTGLVRALL